MRTRPVAVVLSLLVALTRISHGQAASAATLLTKFQDAAIYPIFPVGRAAHNYSRNGYGYEFSFRIGDWTEQLTSHERAQRCFDRQPAPCDSMKLVDTSYVIASIRHFQPATNLPVIGNTASVGPTSRPPGSADTTVTLKLDTLQRTVAVFDLAVGSQLTEIGNNDLVPGWRLSGHIEEWPILTGYATFFPRNLPFAPYAGVSYVLANLKSVKLVQGDSAATVESSANAFAFIAGAGWSIRKFEFFTEANYNLLVFDTHGWKRPMNFPSGAVTPDNLDLKGLTVRLGIQVSFSDKK